ncbi:TetR family transcriptional regulator [Nocardia cyriacigeorgica]|uniref:TetR family transcriptional regulator n=1 Tax=Nocardia cyriacigeorgica TaxID=135487 RepID=UPI00201740B8|nr:TetR family transcriptional regulator [Nocardia cyriacigeorgica]
MPRRSQEDRSRATRTALEEAGLRLFTERGFAGTSAEELVSAAGVTRGACIITTATNAGCSSRCSSSWRPTRPPRSHRRSQRWIRTIC